MAHDAATTASSEQWTDGACRIAWACPGSWACDDYDAERVSIRDSMQLGKPLARRSSSPAAIYCDRRARSATFGTVPSCTHVLTEDFVPDSPTPRLGAPAK